MDCCVINSEAPASVAGSERSGALAVAPVSHRRAAQVPRLGALIATVGVALVPKCPACWSLYAGLSGWFGVSISLERSRLLPLTCACLALTLVSLALSSRRSGSYAALACGALAALGVALGKFALENPLLAHASVLALVLTVLAARRVERRSKLAHHAQAR